MNVAVGNIREWIGQDVVDENGDKIGSLESIYVDTVDDAPFFAAVTVGGVIGGHRLVFAPLIDAVVGPKYLKIARPKKLVKEAPSIDTDGELLAEREAEIFGHYGMRYDTGAGGNRRLGRR